MSDPPSNSGRAHWAAVAVEAVVTFGSQTGQTDPEYLTDPESVAEIVSDLICALLHLVAASGADPDAVLFRGLNYHDFEVAEEAGDTRSGQVVEGIVPTV